MSGIPQYNNHADTQSSHTATHQDEYADHMDNVMHINHNNNHMHTRHQPNNLLQFNISIPSTAAINHSVVPLSIQHNDNINYQTFDSIEHKPYEFKNQQLQHEFTQSLHKLLKKYAAKP